MESYRPICLTSTVGKVERLVTIMSTNICRINTPVKIIPCWVSTWPQHRGPTTPFNQSISDGFQQSSMQRNVVALVDYSRVYEKVWRDDLLTKMYQKIIPRHMVRWIQVWLSNRLTWMIFDVGRSRTVTMSQGVP